ncbi:MAG: DUF58 domain-containing protein [Planctomycetota bacterium]
MSQEHTKRDAVASQVDGTPTERRYELSWATGVFIMTTVFLAIGAINSQNNLLFWSFGVAVGGLVISGITSGAGLMSVRLERSADRLVRAGDPASVVYRVSNVGRWTPVLGLSIRERFMIRGDQRSFAGFSLETGLGHIGPGRAASASAEFVPPARGVLVLDRVEVTSSAPFGLLRKTLVFHSPARLSIGPRRLAIREHASTPSGHAAGPRRPDRRRVGHGDEFFGLREYRPGDSPRLIAWRASARHDQLVVQQMTPPAPPRVLLKIAQAVEGTNPVLFERTLSLAAAVYETSISQGMSVALDARWAGVLLPFRAGERGVTQALEALAAIDAEAHGRNAVRGVPAEGRHGVVTVAATRAGLDVRHSDVVLIADEPAAWLPAGISESDLLLPETPGNPIRATVIEALRSRIASWSGGATDAASAPERAPA